MLEILPGIGLAALRFGMPETEVKAILGEPDDHAEFDSDRHFYYTQLGVSLFFESEKEGLLSGIETDPRCPVRP
ncbi:MAG TPA: hypothetical protein VKK31_17540 [Thermoanaerobaculia bacterium]|nr:hypothetical protein [Thermoanaerobaculia bacterium]